MILHQSARIRGRSVIAVYIASQHPQHGHQLSPMMRRVRHAPRHHPSPRPLHIEKLHLLRRQALRHWRKPLVVFTPKSMLRHPDASSPIADFSHKNFLNVIPDAEIGEADRILVCTGKIGHELQAERKRRKDNSTAIVFLEQLYPFPEKELTAEFARHGEAGDIVWVQEEPANMGALFNMLPRLQRIAGARHVLSVKRSSSASPATGSAKAHEVEQKTLLTLAFTTKG